MKPFSRILSIAAALAFLVFLVPSAASANFSPGYDLELDYRFTDTVQERVNHGTEYVVGEDNLTEIYNASETRYNLTYNESNSTNTSV